MILSARRALQREFADWLVRVAKTLGKRWWALLCEPCDCASDGLQKLPPSVASVPRCVYLYSVSRAVHFLRHSHVHCCGSRLEATSSVFHRRRTILWSSCGISAFHASRSELSESVCSCALLLFSSDIPLESRARSRAYSVLETCIWISSRNFFFEIFFCDLRTPLVYF